jgi:Sulfotransferase family
MPSDDSPAPGRFAWMLGTGRCGSTLVHELLARHPDVGFISNVEDNFRRLEWTGRFSPATFQVIPNRLTEKGRLRYAPSEGYRLLDRRVSPVLSTPFRDLTAADATPWLGGRLRALFAEKAAAQGRGLFLHKFTGWPRAGFLEAVFPGSRYVHVIRDGRAVVNSWLQMDWWRGHRGPWDWPWGPLPERYQAEWEESGRSFAVLAAIAWKILIDAFEEARSAVPPGHWLEVRYEDVLADPRGRFRDITEFLGLAWLPRFERALGRYHFDQGAAVAYRRHLDPSTLGLVDDCLAEHLVRWGYPEASRSSV